MDRRALAALALTLAAAAASASSATPALAAVTACGTGSGHVVSLSNGTASPGSALLGTSFAFSVTYTDNRGCAPLAVTVTVAGVGTVELASSGSTAYRSGVVFGGTMTPPAGTWLYSFSTTSSGPGGVSSATLTAVAPASILVTAPP
ncbi:MAG TPA: hypothetical protein VEY67_12080, partial [Candidatus Dormibacteraeota bacterium]|nr:hypothetical protein [Candidatus Dormibacteraeota bacterium]